MHLEASGYILLVSKYIGKFLGTYIYEREQRGGNNKSREESCEFRPEGVYILAGGVDRAIP